MLIKSKNLDDPKPQPGYEKDGPLEHRWARVRFGHFLTMSKVKPGTCLKCVYNEGSHTCLANKPEEKTGPGKAARSSATGSDSPETGNQET